MVKPNLFKIATKELSHDAVITWLLQWANPQVKNLQPELHQCGTMLLNMFLGYTTATRDISYIEAGRQWQNIDIWAEIYCKDNSKILLIIENKVFSDEHSNQLIRYREIAKNHAESNGFSLECVYVKIGSQPLKVTRNIQAKGYRVIDRRQILEFLKSLAHIHNDILNDYQKFLEDIEDRYQTFKHRKIALWDDNSWVGFYQHIESVMEINMWHFVNNRSGGFWNMSLNWGYWHHFPVYIQVEQGKLCFKIAVADYETGGDSSKMDVNLVQQFVHYKLLDYAKHNGFSEIARPQRLSWKGDYRTIAIVEKDIWLGEGDTIVDLQKVVYNLKTLVSFYDKFIGYIKNISYIDASVEFASAAD